MNYLNDVITYVRRIVKSPSNATLSDNLIIDYINRFITMDVSARMQVFDFKTVYSFETVPGVDRYNMPLYDMQNEGGQTVGQYPVYQGFLEPATVNGISINVYTERDKFLNLWPTYVQSLSPTIVGNGTAGPYTINLPYVANTAPVVNAYPSGLLRGHVDLAGVIASDQYNDPPTDNGVGAVIPTIPVTSISPAFTITTMDAVGNSIVVSDSGIFLTGQPNYGLLISPGNAPYGNTALSGGYSTTSNTINYLTGVATVTFNEVIPAGQNINTQCNWINPGLPRTALFYNNTLTVRSVPDKPYRIELQAYLTPSCFLNSAQAIPFAYMAEYIARGAARKILSDTGDVEQFNFYEPLFKEQELLVWKRSQRQWTSTRTQTIYSNRGYGGQQANSGLFGSGAI